MVVRTFSMNSVEIKRSVMDEKNAKTIHIEILRPENEEYKKYVCHLVDSVQGLISAERSIFESWLAQRSVRLSSMLDDHIASIYSFINRFLIEATYKANELDIDTEDAEKAISELKKLKKQVRDIKTNYKKKAREVLQEIGESQLDEVYISEVEEVVKKVVGDWCKCHVLEKDKKHLYDDANRTAQIVYLATIPRIDYAYPSERIIKRVVEQHLKHDTIIDSSIASVDEDDEEEHNNEERRCCCD